MAIYKEIEQQYWDYYDEWEKLIKRYGFIKGTGKWYKKQFTPYMFKTFLVTAYFLMVSTVISLKDFNDFWLYDTAIVIGISLIFVRMTIFIADRVVILLEYYDLLKYF